MHVHSQYSARITLTRNHTPSADVSLRCPRSAHQALSRVQTKHLEVVDMEAADLLSHLPALCDFIDEARSGGGVVYVHCAAGVSRSATVRALRYKLYPEPHPSGLTAGDVRLFAVVISQSLAG